jgi:hypothetical protein
MRNNKHTASILPQSPIPLRLTPISRQVSTSSFFRLKNELIFLLDEFQTDFFHIRSPQVFKISAIYTNKI